MTGTALANVLAQRFNEVLPEGFFARAVGDSVYLDTPDGLGTSGWAGAVDRDPTNLDLPAEAARTVMDNIQDGVCRTIGDVWPRLDAPGRQLALPDAKREGTTLKMWFGEAWAPTLQVRSVELLQSTYRVDRFLREFTEWASSQGDIHAVALVGSHARGVATSASDVDIVTIATRPRAYVLNRQWAQTFGAIVKDSVEDHGRLTARRVFYTGELEVEYGFTDERWATHPDQGTWRVASDGMQVLFERRPLLSTLLRQLQRRDTLGNRRGE